MNGLLGTRPQVMPRLQWTLRRPAQVPFGEGLVAPAAEGPVSSAPSGTATAQGAFSSKICFPGSPDSGTGGLESAEAQHAMALESTSGSRTPVGLAEAAVGHPCRGASAQSYALHVLSMALNGTSCVLALPQSLLLEPSPRHRLKRVALGLESTRSSCE